MLRRSNSKRNRYVQIGLFIIIYSCYYAYSAVTSDPEIDENVISSYTTITESYDVSNFFFSTKKMCNDLICLQKGNDNFIPAIFYGTNKQRAEPAWSSHIKTHETKLYTSSYWTISTSSNEPRHTKSMFYIDCIIFFLLTSFV